MRIARDAAHRRQSALGARRLRELLLAAPLRRQKRRCGLRTKPRASPMKTSPVCEAIGEHGAGADPRGRRAASPAVPVNILTHCNAGWLATVDWGTALAPIYKAHDGGVPLHVWVDETRPRNQGAASPPGTGQRRRAAHGDRRQRRRPSDAAWRGRSRASSAPTARRAAGDVCNKIGTYLKALAAHDNGVPFYVAAAVADDRLDAQRRGRAKSRSRSARPREVTHIAGLAETARSSRCG